MGNNRPPFLPNTVYHVYNHGNADESIFREKDNYHFFLKRYAHYLYPVAHTYAFCLMPNHFHLMVKIQNKRRLLRFHKTKYPDNNKEPDFAKLISNQFKNFLISYAKSFNKKYDRRGSLFLDNLKRKPITSERHYARLIYYIHRNPLLHGIVDRPSHWPYSSYHLLASRRKPTKLNKQHVFDIFGGWEPFIIFHRQSLPIDRDNFY